MDKPIITLTHQEMLKLFTENQTKIKMPSRPKFQFWLKKTLATLKPKLKEGRLELFFVTSREIRKLNKLYRGQDKSTDVLSFSFMEGLRFPGDDLAGQIFIEPARAKKQALSHGATWSDELEFLFVHALLHVFGFDHENETDFRLMFGLQVHIMPGQKWANFAEQIHLENFGGRGGEAGNRGQ